MELQCPYCLNPGLLDTDFSDCPIDSYRPGVKARGQFWRQLAERPKLVWPTTFETKRHDHQLVFTIGKENFSPKYQSFMVEVLGLDFETEPPLPSSPFFFRSHTTHNYGTEGARESYILFNACRIADSVTSLKVKLHWWPSHNRIFSVENFDFQSASSAEVLKLALSFFSSGRGRPTEHFTNTAEFSTALKDAILRLRGHYEIPSEIEVAALMCNDDSFNARVLRRWLAKSNWVQFTWPEIIKAVIESEKAGTFVHPKLEELNPFARSELPEPGKRT